MNNKHMGRRAMDAAIQQNLIAVEQYSRPNRKAIDHLINRRLVMDHQKYLRQPYVLTSCDLKSCYDRINHTAASLSLQKAGVAPSELTAMFHTIQHMRHKVRTAFGDSDNGYEWSDHIGSWKLPPQGVLQGNGSGPAIWSIISSLLFSILGDQGFRNSFTSSMTRDIIALAGFAYIDDTDLIQTADTVQRAVQKMLDLLDYWTKLVEVTGGRLAPDKCWCYLVDFHFKRGQWRTVDMQENQNIFFNMRAGARHRHDIQQIPTSIGSNMLGVFMAPSGENTQHIEFLRGKAQKWASNKGHWN